MTNDITARFLGDTSSLDRAGKHVEGVTTKIGGAFSKLGGQVGGELGSLFDDLGNGLESIGKTAKGVAPKIAAGGAAVAGLGLALQVAGSKDAAAAAQLNEAIIATGNVTSDYREEIEKTIHAQENFGHRADDTSLALAKLTEATNSPTKAIENMGLVADLAAAKHISLEEAAGLVARVLGGSGGKILKQYGITMKTGGDATANAEAALDQLAQKLRGQAAASVDSFTGKVGVLTAKIEDQVAIFGQKYGPILTAAGVATTALGTVLQVLQARHTAAAAAAAAQAVAEADAAAATTAAGTAAAATAVEEEVASSALFGPIGLIAGVAAAAAAVFLFTRNNKDSIKPIADQTKALGENLDAYLADIRVKQLNAFATADNLKVLRQSGISLQLVGMAINGNVAAQQALTTQINAAIAAHTRMVAVHGVMVPSLDAVGTALAKLKEQLAGNNTQLALDAAYWRDINAVLAGTSNALTAVTARATAAVKAVGKVGHSSQGRGDGSAAGGMVGGSRAMASGGSWSMYEHGYEAVSVSPNGQVMVTPHSGSMGMGGGRTVVLNFNAPMFGTHDAVARYIVKALDEAISKGAIQKPAFAR